MTTNIWKTLADEARAVFHGRGNFTLRAYSEFMPAPFVGIKPVDPDPDAFAATDTCSPNALDVDEYEQAHDIEPGLDSIATVLVRELGQMMRGEPHAVASTLLEGNPAWPPELSVAAAAGKLANDPLVAIAPVALSRSQDDKGNARWTLYGASHTGAGAAFWHGMDATKLAAFVAWAGVTGPWRIYGDAPPALRAHAFAGSTDGLTAIVTFTPFAELPASIRRAYLARELNLLPCPATLVFYAHPKYRELAEALPRANQLPLLHLFPRVEGACAIRIPPSGYLDETTARTHRWQRVERDVGIPDGVFLDKVSRALFSTSADDLGLYDKPLARNAEVWTADSAKFERVLDGTRADRAAIERAALTVDAGGRFGYRLMFPAMRGGARSLYWHAPVIARRDGERYRLNGYASAELDGKPPLTLEINLLARPSHQIATRFVRDAGLPRYTTSHNARKILDAHAMLGPLSPAFVRSMLRIAKRETLDGWLDELPMLGRELRACLDVARDPGHSIVMAEMGTRAFEESIWRSIANLAEGEFRQKGNGDGITVNTNRKGGPAAELAKIVAHEHRDLEALGDHFHDRYRALVKQHGMEGRAECVDHVFRWETDFSFPWMAGWAKNLDAPAERNVILMIPGKRRDEALIMGDHYDTAYMEDLYDADRGGDMLRAPALGADDNHSASTALLKAAEYLLPLSRAGKLERDVWLVHLTGEEFPADSLGARAICQGLVEGNLAFTAEDGSARDVSKVKIAGVYVLDMIGHNTERDRDVFQISPGEGAAAMRLALRMQRATEKWNAHAAQWNERNEGRRDAGRAQRMPDGSVPPPMFEHRVVQGEVRVEWEPASSLFNTDGQAMSDVGIPVVLMMENYDISRTGYHDTLDNMANIDLDYCAALTAIAIEAVADAACAEEV